MLFTSRSRRQDNAKSSNLSILVGNSGTKALEYSMPKDVSESGEFLTPEITNFMELSREPMPLMEERALFFAIRREIEEIKKITLCKHPDSITIILDSPWYFSQTRIITVERNEQFKINKNLIDQLLAEEKEIFLNRASSQFEISENDSARVLEISIMRATLNGYATDSFFEKNAKHLRLSVFISMTIANLADELSSIAEEKFNPEKIILHSSPYVIFKSALPALGIDNAGATIISIGGEITDIAIMRDGIMSETISFGRGLNFVLRRISGAFSITPAEVVSQLRTLSASLMSNNHRQKFSDILANAMNEWQKMFSEAIKHASGSRLLPNRFILIGDGAEFKIFSEYINSEETSGLVYKTAPLGIETLYPKYFRSRLRGTGNQFGGVPSAALLFLSVFSPEQIL